MTPILSRLFSRMLATLFIGLLLSPLTLSAQANPAPKVAAAELVEPELEINPLVTEADELRKLIDIKVSETQQLLKEQSQTTAEDYDAYGRRIASRQLAILDEMDNLCSNILEQEQQNLETAEIRKYAGKLLDAAGEKLIAYIDLVEASQESAADPMQKPGSHIPLDRLYQSLGKQITLRESLGMDVTRQKEDLSRRVITRAERLSGRIEISKESEQAITKKVSAEPTNKEHQLALLDIQEKVAKQAKSLSVTITIMNTLEMDSSAYQRLLIKSTGDITTGILDKGVVTGLFAEWFDEAQTTIRENGAVIIFKLFIFSLVIFIFKMLANIVGKLVERSVSTSSLQLSNLLQDMIISSASRIVLITGVLIALSQVGFSLGPLLAGLGVAGFIVGFALQDTLGNFASGMMILIYRPFDNGDLIETGGVLGTVASMNLVSTTLLTIDNQTMIIPNNKIWGDVIKNITNQRHRRVDMVFGIGYGDDIEKTEKVLHDIVTSHDKVLPLPETTIRLHKLNDSSVDFIVRPWVNTADYWDVYWDITREVKMRFDREGISIPFPQRDVHLYQESTNT
ncbi:mechanosensitive ion channel family protein [Oceanicoccus sagamiensis]|nr:mechanosensitive ion channel family protein [Oceanicoccus sagamiensis]